jgi:hypothetical protein
MLESKTPPATISRIKLFGHLTVSIVYTKRPWGRISNRKKERFPMKKTSIAIALLLAALATAGQLRHPSNPLTIDGKKLSTEHKELPFPICPPDCNLAR